MMPLGRRWKRTGIGEIAYGITKVPFLFAGQISHEGL
jgi:hypothetical protein